MTENERARQQEKLSKLPPGPGLADRVATLEIEHAEAMGLLFEIVGILSIPFYRKIVADGQAAFLKSTADEAGMKPRDLSAWISSWSRRYMKLAGVVPDKKVDADAAGMPDRAV